MKVINWNTEYNHLVRWAIRRMTKDSLKFYKDKKKDWIRCLLMLNDFEKELFKTLPDANDVFEINAEEFSKLCHKYMKKYKNRTIKYFFFNLWTDLRCYVGDICYSFKDFLKDATKEEIEQARKNFLTYKNEPFDDVTHQVFSDDAKVLEYRGIRLIIDNKWNDAWIKYKNRTYRFQLMYDWYYNIDEFIDIVMN